MAIPIVCIQACILTGTLLSSRTRYSGVGDERVQSDLATNHGYLENNLGEVAGSSPAYLKAVQYSEKLG